jgi:hypothetical protein
MWSGSLPWVPRAEWASGRSLATVTEAVDRTVASAFEGFLPGPGARAAVEVVAPPGTDTPVGERRPPGRRVEHGGVTTPCPGAGEGGPKAPLSLLGSSYCRSPGRTQMVGTGGLTV